MPLIGLAAIAGYEAANAFAVGTDEATRVRLGASADTPPEMLYYLASDPAVTVRAAVAMNEATPIRAAHLLAEDEDERVRALIARQLAALAPGLTDREHERVRRQTYEALVALVADQAVRVRATLSEVLKELPDAPRELILALAHDPAVMVSEPVIRLSPLLTAQDLLTLLAPSRPPTTLAVARRPLLDETVCDAIAATADVAAIRALLQNRSAAIRESTLDALVAKATTHIEWHEPLVHRPTLSHRSAKRLSEMVADNLLGVLAARTDLDPSLLADLRRRLDAAALAWTVPPPARWGAGPKPASVAPPPVAGEPSNAPSGEAGLLEAIQRGDVRSASVLLALAAGVSLAVVDRAVSLRSTKGLVSLLWKAGYGMAIAGPLQALLTRVAPNELLAPTRDGGFPLAVEEMRWQVEFLSRGGR